MKFFQYSRLVHPLHILFLNHFGSLIILGNRLTRSIWSSMLVLRDSLYWDLNYLTTFLWISFLTIRSVMSLSLIDHIKKQSFSLWFPMEKCSYSLSLLWINTILPFNGHSSNEFLVYNSSIPQGPTNPFLFLMRKNLSPRDPLLLRCYSLFYLALQKGFFFQCLIKLVLIPFLFR